MLSAFRISPSLTTLNPAKLLHEPYPSFRLLQIPNPSLSSPAGIFPFKAHIFLALRAVSPDGSFVKELDDPPMSIELKPIDESRFDRVIADAQQLEESIVIVWMASWCRKCIYLKPKLEKLAADYSPRLRFYCVDVNKVSHKLVTRAGVTKMPTIQLWKDGRKQVEVIGGHKAHHVINEVREMIESRE